MVLYRKQVLRGRKMNNFLIGATGVVCDTESEAKALFDIMKNHGITWIGESNLDYFCWNDTLIYYIWREELHLGRIFSSSKPFVYFSDLIKEEY